MHTIIYLSITCPDHTDFGVAFPIRKDLPLTKGDMIASLPHLNTVEDFMNFLAEDITTDRCLSVGQNPVSEPHFDHTLFAGRVETVWRNGTPHRVICAELDFSPDSCQRQRNGSIACEH